MAQDWKTERKRMRRNKEMARMEWMNPEPLEPRNNPEMIDWLPEHSENESESNAK